MSPLRLCALMLLLIASTTLPAATGRYMLTWRADPATTMVVGWEQVSGSSPQLHYDTVDHGTDAGAYANAVGPDVSRTVFGTNRRYVRLSGLQPDTAYYFVISDSSGVSDRMWFRTGPDAAQPFSLIAGGDSRNNRTPRQRANSLVAKLRPLAVMFGGDMTDKNTDTEWQEWLDDWQLTTSSDGRMYPVIAARGNHDRDGSLHKLFDTPNSSNYYALTFGDNLLRTYTLNSEIPAGGTQGTWLANDLAAHAPIHTIAQYHKPMRPHYASKSEGDDEYLNWAQLFYDHAVDLVIECDSHMVKRTHPVRPSTGAGSDEGFIQDDAAGTVYIGEGCWGAPLRSNDDDKDWTQASGRFNQVNWIHVHTDRIEVRTAMVDTADQAGSVTDSDPFTPPTGLDLWSPASGSVVTIPADGESEPGDDLQIVFQQGVDGYSGTADTNLFENDPASSVANATTWSVDSDEPYQSGKAAQVLLRFADIVGDTAIPAGSTITSATLVLDSVNPGAGATFHRMLVDWPESATWNGMNGGISADGTEAATSADLNTGSVTTGTLQLDVTTSVQAWVNGAANHGWALLPRGTNGWDVTSSEGSVAPRLQVTYTPPEAVTTPDIAVSGDGVAISDGDDTPDTGDGTDFGSLDIDGFVVDQSFIISNNGDADLAIANVQIAGTGAAAFSISTQPASVVGPGGTSELVVAFDPSSIGEHHASITITSDDPDAPDFDFALLGTGEDLAEASIVFQQGVDGYTGTTDTNLSQDKPTTNFANATSWSVDNDDPSGSGNDAQVLLRFADIVGDSAIPAGATIQSATLILDSVNPGSGARFHRMLVDWSETATWSDWNAGISADGSEAASGYDLDTGAMSTGTIELDVTTSVQAWVDGAANHGWALLATGTNGWDVTSSEGSIPPRLEVVYVLSATAAITLTGDGIAIPDGDTTPDESDGTDFGVLDIDTESQAQTFVIGNDGDADLNIAGIAISGSDAAAFSITSAAATVVAPGGTTDLVITFDPAAVGIHDATLTITSDDPDQGTFDVAITGTGSQLVTLVFEQGLGGYTGTSDTNLMEDEATTDHASGSSWSVDNDDPYQSGKESQALLRFSDIIGSTAVPSGAEVVSASLHMNCVSRGSGLRFHRMLIDWSESATWSSMTAGVSADDSEAVAAHDLQTGWVPSGAVDYDVTTSVQAWAGGASNHGWILLPQGSNGVDIESAQSANPPRLEVTYRDTGVPETNQ